MVYESDFYTVRRPYSRPTITSYSVTPYRPLSSRSTYIMPIYYPSKVRLSVLLGELNRIQHRPRQHHAYVPTEDFLNSRPLVAFDDETKYIRAAADKLMRYVYTRVPHSERRVPISVLSSYDRYFPDETSCGWKYYPRYTNSYRDVPNNILNMSYYYEPSRVTIGRGHLACVSFAGGRGYPRRKQIYRDENRDIGDEIKFRSYYNKNRHHTADALLLPTGFASRLLLTERHPYCSLEDARPLLFNSKIIKASDLESKEDKSKRQKANEKMKKAAKSKYEREDFIDEIKKRNHENKSMDTPLQKMETYQECKIPEEIKAPIEPDIIDEITPEVPNALIENNIPEPEPEKKKTKEKKKKESRDEKIILAPEPVVEKIEPPQEKEEEIPCVVEEEKEIPKPVEEEVEIPQPEEEAESLKSVKEEEEISKPVEEEVEIPKPVEEEVEIPTSIEDSAVNPEEPASKEDPTFEEMVQNEESAPEEIIQNEESRPEESEPNEELTTPKEILEVSPVVPQEDPVQEEVAIEEQITDEAIVEPEIIPEPEPTPTSMEGDDFWNSENETIAKPQETVEDEIPEQVIPEEVSAQTEDIRAETPADVPESTGNLNEIDSFAENSDAQSPEPLIEEPPEVNETIEEQAQSSVTEDESS